MNRNQSTIICITALTAATGLLSAGPLNPPAGPVASTYKTLSDVEPRTAVSTANTPGDASDLFVISQAGSYYLTANIQGQSGKTSILITAKGVKLDLNGFTIQGGGPGITASGAAVAHVNVSNGRITGCTGMGLNLAACSDSDVEDVRVASCSNGGVSVGTSSIVQRVHIDGCAQTGLSLGYFAVAEDCSITNGVAPSAGGVFVSSGSRLIGCLSEQNTGAGFLAAGTNNEGLVMTRCTAYANTDAGFDLRQMNHGTLESCSAHGSGASGFQLGAGFILRDCIAASCTLDGFVLQGDASIAERCISDSNDQVGFTISGAHTTVQSCKSTGNIHQGYHVTGNGSMLLSSTAQANGPTTFAGFWIDTGGCRVEGNLSNGNGVGFYVNGQGNMILRNSATANVTNYFAAIGNHVASIISPPSNSTAINGNSGGSPLSTDPNANFVY
jgi:parallel beta-helix repeat protein